MSDVCLKGSFMGNPDGSGKPRQIWETHMGKMLFIGAPGACWSQNFGHKTSVTKLRSQKNREML